MTEAYLTKTIMMIRVPIISVRILAVPLHSVPNVEVFSSLGIKQIYDVPKEAEKHEAQKKETVTIVPGSPFPPDLENTLILPLFLDLRLSISASLLFSIHSLLPGLIAINFLLLRLPSGGQSQVATTMTWISSPQTHSMGFPMPCLIHNLGNSIGWTRQLSASNLMIFTPYICRSEVASSHKQG